MNPTTSTSAPPIEVTADDVIDRLTTELAAAYRRAVLAETARDAALARLQEVASSGDLA